MSRREKCIKEALRQERDSVGQRVSLLSSNLEGRIINTQSPQRWQCHACKAGSHLYANTTSCPGVLPSGHRCGHKMCLQRKRGRDIPTSTSGQRVSPLSSNIKGPIMNTRSPQCHACEAGPHTYVITPTCIGVL